MRAIFFVLLSICLALGSPALADSMNGFIYHGRILKPDNTPVISSSVDFTISIYGREAFPVAKRCLLYQEKHSGVDMSNSQGTFELNIGEGTHLFSPPEIAGAGLSRIFLNSPSFMLTGLSCSGGTADFSAESLDTDREMEVKIEYAGNTLNLPSQKLRAQPWAMQAMEIGGYSADYLAKVNAPLPFQLNASAVMFLSNNFVMNANGTPTFYGDDTARITNLQNPTSPQDAATKAYVDSAVGSGFSAGNGIDITAGTIKIAQMSATPGQVIKWNGTAWAPDTDTGGLSSVSYTDLNSAGATVNDGMIVSDSSGRLFKLQCAANQVANWTASNGWECIDPANLVGVGHTTISGGTQNYLTKFNAAGDNVVNSAIYENAGNVGIGTATPSSIVDINGAQTIRGLAVAPADAPLDQARMYYDTVADKLMLSVNNTGYQEIATASGVSGAYVAKTGDTMTGPLVNNSNSASTALAVTQSGAGHAATFMGGNVGIGITSPTAKLHVEDGSVKVTKEYYKPAVDITYGSTTSGGRPAVSAVQAAGTGGMSVFYISRGMTDGKAGLALETTGETINGATPGWFAGLTGNIGVGSGHNFTIAEMTGGTSANTDAGAPSLQARLTVYPGGNVGVGTATPTSFGGFYRTFEVAGGSVTDGGVVVATNSDKSVTAQFSQSRVGSISNTSYDIVTNNTPRMTVLSGGNVGIGTATPSSILDINGAQTIRGLAVAPANAPVDQARIYYDTVADKLMLSVNNTAYQEIATASGVSGSYVAKTGDTMTGKLTINNAASTTKALDITSNSTVIGSTNTAVSLTMTSGTVNQTNTGISIYASPSSEGAATGMDLNLNARDTVYGIKSVVTKNWGGGALLGSAYGVYGDAGTDSSLGYSYGGYFKNTGSNGTSYGIYSDVTSATAVNKYAAAFMGGNVGIGVASPQYALDVAGSINLYKATTNARLQLVGDASRSAEIFYQEGANKWGSGAMTNTIGGLGSRFVIASHYSAGAYQPDVIMDGNGKVIIGGLAPSARLHLPAGTTAAGTSPLKFEPTSATLMSVAENGAMEFDGTDFYLTAGGTRKKIMTSAGGAGDYVAKAGDTMTGPLVNNSNSASTALAVTQSGAGYAATFMGGRIGVGLTAPSYLMHLKTTAESGDLLAVDADGKIGVKLGIENPNGSPNHQLGVLKFEGTTNVGANRGIGGKIYANSTNDFNQANNGVLQFEAQSNGGTVGTANTFVFNNNGTAQMTIGPTGIVTIPGSLSLGGRAVASVSADTDVTVSFASSNMIRTTQAGACGSLAISGTAAGGSFTITMPSVTATCTLPATVDGLTVKAPSGYTAGDTVTGVVYTLINDGTNVWISYVPF